MKSGRRHRPNQIVESDGHLKSFDIAWLNVIVRM